MISCVTMNTEKRLFAVRGAVCCQNTVGSIQEEVTLLYRTILEKNAMDEADIVSVQFTMTGDLDARNPASALRRGGYAADLPLFVSAEPPVQGALARTIRILITFYGTRKPDAVYLHGAEVLRPDLAAGAGSAGERERDGASC